MTRRRAEVGYYFPKTDQAANRRAANLALHYRVLPRRWGSGRMRTDRLGYGWGVSRVRRNRAASSLGAEVRWVKMGE